MQASEADGSSVINRSSISGFWTNDGSTLSTKEHSVDKAGVSGVVVAVCYYLVPMYRSSKCDNPLCSQWSPLHYSHQPPWVSTTHPLRRQWRDSQK